MLHKIKLHFIEVHMQKLVLSVFLILFLIPFPQGFSQEYSDNVPTLTVTLRNETPFVLVLKNQILKEILIPQ